MSLGNRIFEPVKGPFLLPFYSAVLLPWYFLKNPDSSLDQISRDMIGIATIHGVDIGKRVDLFFIALVLALLAFATVNIAMKYLIVKRNSLLPGSDYLNWLSLFGILSVFASTTGMRVEPLTGLILSILFLSFLKTFSLDGRNYSSENLPYLIISSIGFSFFFRDVCLFSGIKSSGFFFNDFVLFTGIAFLILNIILSKYARLNLLRPGWIPMFSSLAIWISVAACEIPYILAGRGIDGFDSVDVYLVLVSIALIISAFHQASILKRHSGGYRLYTFITITGIFTFAYYSPVLSQSAEMFETANPVLSLERLFTYGELPLYDTFNSHLFFELFTGFIYVALNGYYGMDFLVYDFLHYVFFAIVLFFFLRRFIENDLIAGGILLLYPFAMDLIPLTFAVVLLAAMACEKWIPGKGVKGLLLLFLFMGIMVLWRIDFGYASILSAIALLLILFLGQKDFVRPKQVIIAGALSLLFPMIALITGFIRNPDFDNNLKQGFHYLLSEQSYGLLNVASQVPSLNGIHYYTFPAFILLILAAILLNLNTNLKERRFQTMTMLFLILFYFFNFQRGLIRHGLAEGSSQWLSSFAFFIIPAYVFFLPMSEKLIPYRKMIFLSLSCILILTCQFPLPASGDFSLLRLESAFMKEAEHNPSGNSGLVRMVDEAESPAVDLAEVKAFFDHNLLPGETFYDYSNSPMLYYYLKRRPPSYFNQMLLSMHDDYLQNCIVDSLQSGIKFIIHSNFPENWYDAQDGIPKNVRHCRIAECINQNFRPYIILGKYCIWMRNNIIPDDASYLDFELDSTGRNLSIINNQFEKTPGIKLLVRICFNGMPRLEVDSQEYSPAYSIGKLHYFHLPHVPSTIKSVSGLKFFKDSIKLEYCIWYPDYYSGRPKCFDLHKLPGILANNVDIAGFSANSLQPESHPGDSPAIYKVPLTILKDAGNYLMVEGCSGHDEDQRCTIRLLADSLEIGRFTFDLRNGNSLKNHFIRLSTMYNWYSNKLTHIAVHSEYFASEIGEVSLLTPLHSEILKENEDQ